MAHVVSNVEEFKNLTEKGVVLIDFYADWCGPCRMQAPIIEQISDYYKKNITVLKVNTDHAPELAEMFRIRSIPTLVLIKDKTILKQEAGFKTMQQLQDWINPNL